MLQDRATATASFEIRADKVKLNDPDDTVRTLERTKLSSSVAGSGYRFCSQPSQEFEVAGIKFRSLKVQEAYKAKSLGTKLLLVREPNNRFDSRAIAIYAALKTDSKDASAWEWTHVGYVPKRSLHVFDSLPPEVVLEGRKHTEASFKLASGYRMYRG